ncbi:cell division protein ZapB [Desulfobacula sp.]|uniref:cell division protein ZapB n=1 Tax=Desulfobacula sp. TaxID=2593537 RepID=UPI0039B8D72B
MGNERIKQKFDDINDKIDFMIEFCHELQQENKELVLKIRGLESELDTKDKTEKQFSEQDELIQSKIDGLLKKLNYFSNSAPGEYSSNL